MASLTDNSPIISIRSVTKRFPGVIALADVTLDVRAGELHAICGENGAGKSTLMKILSGVITDYDGELLLAGRSVRFKGTREAEAAGISIMHQELNLVEQLSAAANIFLGREIRGWLRLRDGRLVKTLDRRATTPQEVTHLMVGREIEAIEFGGQRQAGEVLLRVKALSLPWPGHARGWRLKDVSFELRRGEVLGIAGLMGAGRTELLECLFGAAAEKPQGRIELLGEPVSFRHPREACAAKLGLVTEDRKRLGLFTAMNVGENISICTLG